MNLAGYVRERMQPLLPITTGVSPRLDHHPGIEMIAFDIYGTLLVSAAGDISAAAGRVERQKAMSTVLQHLGCVGSDDWIASIVTEFETLQTKAHESLGLLGVIHSELDMREIWRELLTPFVSSEVSNELVDEVALIYECEVNPVWAMPSAREVLVELRNREFTLGIVSNAQHYTRSIFEGMLGKSTLDFGIETTLSVFSYEVGEGKPSSKLYQNLADAAEEMRIGAEQILYVGNDVRKDIEPARSLGFRTALFAGDQRSLRFGERDVSEALALADCVVTDLRQLLKIV